MTKRVFTKEHKKKLSDSATGRKLSCEHKEKIKKALSDRVWTDDMRENCSKAHIGIRHTDEAKAKIGLAKSGENCTFWNGGVTNTGYPNDWTMTLKNSIRQRDDYMCFMCGNHQDELDGVYKKLSVHHIDYNKNNCNPSNLISLCQSCHAKTNYDRSYWLDYFKDIKLYDE